MKRFVNEQFDRLEKTAPIPLPVYSGANGWKFVALVGMFIAAYVALAIAGVDIPPELSGLAGAAAGVNYGRTFKR